ncbi:M56 family metallopeptidase [Winogradskyella flava]|uniref:M56 family metallopeptidase n=1 Tax=Winogradskyella flava TaxID=1884876 RepID=UPI0024900DBE|nr:M56 family metallopeptidase [Winogradskyella flava]
MLYTIIQIISFQALFLLVYDLFLKKETFFNHNRVYLLVTSILSLVLPFIKFPELRKMTSNDVVIQLPEVFIGPKIPTEYEVLVAEQTGIVLEQPQLPIWKTIVLTGIVIAALIFLFKIAKLYWLKYDNPKRWYKDVLIVRLLKSSAAFSFFNTIFLGEQIPESDKATIFKHELVHVKELHTLDLLFFEMLRIVLWFNPLVYIYQMRIKELHEFIADAKAVKQHGKTKYYKSLLNQVFDVNTISFTNTFFKTSLIKKRITMLQKSKSKQLHLIKYTLLIPLVFGMLIYTSTEVRAQEKTETIEEGISQELTDEELIEKYYQEFLQMDKDESEYREIINKISVDYNDKYIESREDYLKFIAFGRYMMQTTIESKSENGNLTQNDVDRMEDMKAKTKSYTEFREWKKTQEAKDLWEASAKYGELRLVVNDIANKTKSEQKRFDALIEQLNFDPDFHKLIVCDTKGGSRLELSDPQNISSTSAEIIEVEENVEVPFAIIDEAPTTIECQGLKTSEERKRCMSTFVSTHVNKNFNKDIADSLNLKGRQRIFTSFKIDKNGDVSYVSARAAHPALEDEAKRVIKSLPKFIPGKQKGKAVVVPYSLPIVFQIVGNANTPNNDRFNDSLIRKNIRRLESLIAERDRILQSTSEKNPVVVNLNKQIDSIDKVLVKPIKNKQKLKNLIAQRDRILQSSSEKNPVVVNLNKQIDSIDKVLVKSIRNKQKREVDKAINNGSTKIPYSVIDIAPIHPNCKTINSLEEQKKCTSTEVQKHVNRNFNMDLPEKLGLTGGKQQINIAFTIDKEGTVKSVKSRSSHPKLDEEAKRIINLLPQFIPGEHNGKAVDVAYSLPITFQIVDDKKKKD